MRIVSERDIAICNKKISKVIRKAKTSSVLKVRVAVERKLYYGYRFISEFSGKSIDYGDVKAFRHQFYKKGSITSRSLEGISKRIKETKTQIDNCLLYTSFCVIYFSYIFEQKNGGTIWRLAIRNYSIY